MAVARKNLVCHHDATDDGSIWDRMSELTLSFDDSLSENVFLEEDEDDLQEKLAYISHEFCNLGIIPYKDNRTVSLDFKNLILATFALLSNYHHLMASNSESSERQVKALDDLASLQLAHTRLKDTLVQGERTIVRLQESQRVLRKENSTLASKTKLDKEEIRRLNSAMQAREVQYRNDIRKREHQIEKLKDRISQFLTKKNEPRFPGIEISNHIARKDGSRAKWNTRINAAIIEEQMQRDVNSTYEARFLTLSQENSHIRETLFFFYKKLEELCKTTHTLPPTSTSYNSNVENINESGLDELRDGHFHMPLTMTIKLIKANLECKLSRIANLLLVTEKKI